MSVSVGPHEFVPLRRFSSQCRACYEYKAWHPTVAWVEARPIREKVRHWPWLQRIVNWLWRVPVAEPPPAEKK